jgi:protein SCO1
MTKGSQGTTVWPRHPGWAIRLLGSVGAVGLALWVILAFGQPTPADAHPFVQQIDEVGFDQQLGQSVPLDLEFVDENGQAVRLGDVFGRQPVILTLNYLHCPNFCTLVMDGVAERLDEVGLEVGQAFRVVTVSIDPREGPPQALAQKSLLIRHYAAVANPGGWQFLTGSAEAITRLTEAVGFQYAYEAASDEYAHPAGIVVLTSDGRIARYLYGVDFHPRDLRLALVEAGENQIGTPVDQFLLRCFRYDPATGRYSLAALTLLRVAGGLTVLGMAVGWLWLRRHDKKPRAPVST